MNPNLTSVLQNLSELIQSAKVDQAWILCQETLSTHADSAELQVIWGYLCLEKRLFQKAKTAFLKALELGAQDPKVYTFLANAARFQGDWHEVRQWESRYLAQLPNDHEALIRLGAACLKLNQTDQAVSNFHKALDQQLNKDNLNWVETMLGFILAQLPQQRDLLLLQAQLFLKQKKGLAAQQTMAASYLIQVGKTHSLAEAKIERVQIFPFELEHHLAQLYYLLQTQSVPFGFESIYQSWLELSQSLNGQDPFQSKEVTCWGARFLKRPFYNLPLPEFNSLLHPDLDIAEIEALFLTKQPGIVVLEPLLKPEVLEALHEYCLRSTLWHHAYPTGYLGSSWHTGFHPLLIFQLAEELQTRLPRIFGKHVLNNLWSFKCDQRSQGTGVHGDEAALNLNLWLTPTIANLNPEAGGLVVYDKAAPADWSFGKYNNASQMPLIYAFLKKVNATPQRIPYRQNRAVLFSSDLFHESDQLNFAPGFRNQRLNITLLFGKRRRSSI
jgi:tetratricopeptide (TPR) repeat protein